METTADATKVEEFPDPSWYSVHRWCRWKPTSMASLAEVERKIINCLKSTVDKFYVKLPQSNHRIWTLALNRDKTKLPLVMVHGMGGGVGLWAQNLDTLASKRPVYAFDLLGFGRSSRPNFSSSAQLVEMEFVESIEEWRREMKLDKMILLGHSLGAYIVSAYALKYPQNIQHLFLVDPWGFPEKPTDSERSNRIPLWVRAIGTLLSPFNPLAAVRAAGPFGPGLIRRFRPDLQEKFSELFEDDTILDYIYHCNAQQPSGETAFKSLSSKFGWAKQPMILRMGDIDKDLPITFVYGSRTWMDRDCGYHTRFLRNESHVDVEIVKGAGHHVYADRAGLFNALMVQHLEDIDNKADNDLTTTDIDEAAPARTETEVEQVPITQL